MDYIELDFLDKAIEEVKQLTKFKDTMPEDEYKKMFMREAKKIHKKYDKLLKEELKKRKRK